MKPNKSGNRGHGKDAIKRGPHPSKPASGARPKDGKSNVKKSVKSVTLSGVSTPGASSVSQHDSVAKSKSVVTSKSTGSSSKKKLVESHEKSSKGVKRKSDQINLKASVSANNDNVKAKKVKKQVMNHCCVMILSIWSKYVVCSLGCVSCSESYVF